MTSPDTFNWCDTPQLRNSKLVCNVRKLISKGVPRKPTGNINLRKIAFGPRSSSGFRFSYTLIVNAGNRYQNVGEVLYNRSSSRSDPVMCYLAVAITGDLTTVFEAYALRESSDSVLLTEQGRALGSIEEVPAASDDRSWWKKLFGGRRRWEIFLRNRNVATVTAEYPVSTSTKLLFVQTDVDADIEISLASRFFGNSDLTRLVIPNDAIFVAPEVESLYFLIKLLFRTRYFTLDFSET